MRIEIVEVALRDGLQNESVPVSTELKAELARSLAGSGLRHLEAASFVSPKAVPQMADADVLWPLLPDVDCSALVPNVRGLERALAVGVRHIALFTGASESFVQRNIRMSVAESLSVFAEVASAFRSAVPGGRVRGYVSTAFECPYEGRTAVSRVVAVAKALLDLGCDELSIADTIGVAAPNEVREVWGALSAEVPSEKLAFHFHDTRGTAVANALTAVELGCRTLDSSAGGLGGCPFAPGAGGNLATEDLVYALHRSGLETGIDLERLAKATLPVLSALGREPESRAQRAVLSARERP